MKLDAIYNEGILTLTPKGRDDWFELRVINSQWHLYEIPNHGGLPVYKDKFFKV